jgi:hypothetical protein
MNHSRRRRLALHRGIACFAIVLLASSASAVQTSDASKRVATAQPTQGFDSSAHRASDEEQHEIAQLIVDLAAIEKPDIGFVSTMEGTQFAPVASTREFRGGLLGIDHGVETSHAVERLVAFGPKALPQLLAALSDATPTKLVLEHVSVLGGMWYANELQTNPRRPREVAVLAEHPAFFAAATPKDQREAHTPKHVVTRGDIAFVIVGQIVNRNYQCVRYQPTACHVIVSPTHDPLIAELVRAMWSSEDPARMLYDSLSAEFPASKAAGGMEPQEEREASSFRGGAIQRLAYYFPLESRDRVVRELDLSNAGSGTEIGAPTLKALAFNEDPQITDAIRRLVERGPSSYYLHAALSPAFVRRNPELVAKQLTAILANAPAYLSAMYGPESQLLQDAMTYVPDLAPSLFDAFLKTGSTIAFHCVANFVVKNEPPLPWAPALLAPWLDNRAEVGWDYGPEYDRHPLRLCDEAAQAIAKHLPGATFLLEGEHSDLDAQIADLKRLLAGKPVLAQAKHAVEPIDFAKLPLVAPTRTLEISDHVHSILAFSDTKTIYALLGYRAQGWALGLLEIDAQSGKTRSRSKIDEWQGNVSTIRASKGQLLYAYHGYEGGHVIVHDLRLGREVARFPTPFHDGVSMRDPLLVRNMSDMALSGDGKWIFALTSDGSLHTIDVASGAHEVVWKRDASAGGGPLIFPQLMSDERHNRALIEFDSGNAAPALWDQDRRSMATIEKVPTGGWTRLAGKYGLNEMNGRMDLWDLDTRKPIALPLPPMPELAPFAIFGENRPRSACEFDANLATLVVSVPAGVFVIDLLENRPLVRLDLPESRPNRSFFFSADGKTLFCITEPVQAAGEQTDTKIPVYVALFDVASFKR